MTRRPKQTKPEEIETKPDGWGRFTKAVNYLALKNLKKARDSVFSFDVLLLQDSIFHSISYEG